MTTLRTAVVGLKGMGRCHLEDLSAHPRAQLTAVCDLDADSANAAAQTHAAKAYTDYRDLLAKEPLDTIVFAHVLYYLGVEVR